MTPWSFVGTNDYGGSPVFVFIWRYNRYLRRPFCQITVRRVPQNCNLHSPGCDNLKTHTILIWSVFNAKVDEIKQTPKIDH